MLKRGETDFLESMTTWVHHEKRVEAAVLFGSRTRKQGAMAAADRWSDVDLQIVTRYSGALEKIDWAATFPSQQFCLQVIRRASGGVRKLTLLFADSEADLVLVPAVRLKLARFALALGLHRHPRFPKAALNELATIMSGGYRFLKGEAEWGNFYANIVQHMPGARVSDEEIRTLADIFLCELLWVLKKVDRGEWVAVQRTLHRSLLETNVILLHELRLRRGMLTFREARRVEQLVSADELDLLKISARLQPEELVSAAWHAFAGLLKLLAGLEPGWKLPSGVWSLLEPYLQRHDSATKISINLALKKAQQ